MGRWAPVELGPDAILFSDDHIVAVDKPSGVLSDASRDPGREHLGTALRRWAGQEDADFFPAHRLDLGTSGVVLFARTKASASALMTQFQERAVTKRYQAVVGGPGTSAWTVGHSFDRRSYLRHQRGTSQEVRSGGKPAQTHFVVTDRDRDLAVVQASPTTGRTHQLRVHLAAVGAPILGDDRYGLDAGGGSQARTERLWLHAYELSLAHPDTGELLKLRSRLQLALTNGTPTEQPAPEAHVEPM